MTPDFPLMPKFRATVHFPNFLCIHDIILSGLQCVLHEACPNMEFVQPNCDSLGLYFRLPLQTKRLIRFVC